MWHLHQPPLLLPVLLPSRTRRARGALEPVIRSGSAPAHLGLHPRGPHDLQQLEPEGGDVVLDLVHVVLGHALVLGLPLLL